MNSAAEKISIGFDEAKKAIFARRAKPHQLWVLLSHENERERYALKPSPWEGAGEYQRVSFSDGRDVLVRLPCGEALPVHPRHHPTRATVR